MVANVIPESYPFLRIARQFDLDYGYVLQVADARRHDQPMPVNPVVGDTLPFGELKDFASQVDEANHVQHLIRTGVIDWQTGATKGGCFDHE